MEIREHKVIRASHITGPTAVLVGIRFGCPVGDAPTVLLRVPFGKSSEVMHDTDRFVSEVLSGVEEANTAFSGYL